MSVTNGGTALKPCSRGGRFPGSAGSAGISITLRTAHLLFLPPSSRYHVQMEDERSFRETTTPTNPKVLLGSWAGRSSSTICCSAPRSSSCRCRRLSKSQMCSLRPYFPASSNSGLRPSFTIFGVPHSEVIMVAALLLPLALQLKRSGIHQEDAARTIATGRTERAAINAVGAAMNSVWRRVAGLLNELFRLDHFHDLGMVVTRFRIHDVNPGRCDTRND